MASYTLQIDLLGGEKAESILSKLSGLSGALSSGGGVFSNFGKGLDPLKIKTTTIATAFRTAANEAIKLKTILSSIGSGGAMGKNFWNNFNESFADLKEKAIKAAAKHGIDMFGNALPEPKVTFTENTTQNWHDAHIKEWAEKQNTKAGIDPSQVGFTDYEEADRLKKQKEDDKIADARATWRNKMKADRKRKAEKLEQDVKDFKKDMSFLMMPLFNPGSMWASLFSGRQTFSALNTEHGTAFRAKHLGGMGAAGATALLVGGATAAGLALKALTVTVKETLAAYENARQIYSKALQNGMGLQWSTKRGLLAQIMGVSEQDVFRFGAQMNYLNPKLEQAASILAKTATPLTQVSWEFKILKVDFESMFALIAEMGTPAVLGFTGALDGLIKWLTSHTSYLNALVNGAASGAASAILGNASGPMGAIMKMFGLYGSIQQAKSAMPSPQAWMKQLPASHLEHMGLVVGGGGRSNYAQQTAKNTAVAVKYLQKIAMSVPVATPMGTFGMVPMTNNP